MHVDMTSLQESDILTFLKVLKRSKSVPEGPPWSPKAPPGPPKASQGHLGPGGTVLGHFGDQTKVSKILAGRIPRAQDPFGA